MAIDINNLTDEDIRKLKAQFGIKDEESTRSPGFKPQRDMRAPQTAKERLNRPHFEWSADDDKVTVIKPFPRLFWNEKGQEVCIASAEDMEQRVQPSWTSAPPIAAGPIDPMERLQAEFAALSADDQAFVLAQQKQSRLARIHELMAGLSEQDLALLAPKPSQVGPIPATDLKTKKSA